MSTRCYLRQTSSLRLVLTAVIFCLQLLYTVPVLAQDVKCKATWVEPLANTSVTCHFPEDVRQTKRDFSIVLYEGKHNERTILNCLWVEENMNCSVSSGYKYNRMISHELTLEIPRVSAEHIGSYACKLVNMDNKHIKPCELKTKLVGKTMCDVPSVKQMSQTSLTCYFPEDILNTKTSLTIYHYTRDNYTDPVQSCQWKKNSYFSNTMRGYQSDCSFTDHLTLRILRASKVEEGMYSCDITGLGTVRSENCSFILKKDAVNSSCSIPSVQEMEATTLTCSFSVDMNETRRDFTVVRLGGENNNDVEILRCSWVEDQMKCSPTTGYEFNKIVTDQLVINVPRPSLDHNGTYACHVTGSVVEGFEPCEFIVTKDPLIFIKTNVIPVVVALVISLLANVVLWVISKRCQASNP